MLQLPDYMVSFLKNRGYFHDGEETWEDMSRRVAHALATAENPDEQALWEEKFYKLLSEQRFVNSTPTLMNADANNMGGLSSCFVIDIKDDMMKIHEAIGKCAKIYQYNGGVGFDISTLRPAQAPLGTAHGFAGGPVTFMQEFNDAAISATKFNHRKSATKIDMQVWHPDIFEFIHCKDDGVSLTKMNISVSICDAFMKSVKNDALWYLQFPDYEEDKEYYNEHWDGDLNKWLSSGHHVKVYKTVKARDLYREICKSAWKRGDPGVSFYNHLNLKNPNKHIGKVSGTNPCAEFNSLPYTSCCLGSFNIMKYIVKDGPSWIDYSQLHEDVFTAVRMLDDVITVNKYPLKEIEKMTKGNRSIGIGVMGVADALYVIGKPYDDIPARNFIRDLMYEITSTAINASHKLAEERGCYHNWEGSAWKTEMHNSDLTSIAPTGSISTICGVSSSIEPNFGLVYERHTVEGNTFFVVNKIFEQYLRAYNLYSDDILKRISNNHGSCRNITEIPENVRKVFVTAHDISPENHILMTAAAQKEISLSVSKTVNLPFEATVEDVMNAYMFAYDNGLLGITVYRDGCREDQVLTTGTSYAKEAPKTSENTDVLEWGNVAKTNDDFEIGLKRKLRTGCGSVHLQCYFDTRTGRMVECFADRGGLGGCTALLSTVSRLISRELRLGDTPEEIQKQLSRTLPCSSYSAKRAAGNETAAGFSCASAIGLALVEMNEEMKRKLSSPELSCVKSEPKETQENLKDSKPIEKGGNVCPECGEELAPDGGCVVCPSCGWSKCG